MVGMRFASRLIGAGAIGSEFLGAHDEAGLAGGAVGAREAVAKLATGPAPPRWIGSGIHFDAAVPHLVNFKVERGEPSTALFNVPPASVGNYAEFWFHPEKPKDDKLPRISVGVTVPSLFEATGTGLFLDGRSYDLTTGVDVLTSGWFDEYGGPWKIGVYFEEEEGDGAGSNSTVQATAGGAVPAVAAASPLLKVYFFVNGKPLGCAYSVRKALAFGAAASEPLYFALRSQDSLRVTYQPGAAPLPDYKFRLEQPLTSVRGNWSVWAVTNEVLGPAFSVTIATKDGTQDAIEYTAEALTRTDLDVDRDLVLTLEMVNTVELQVTADSRFGKWSSTLLREKPSAGVNVGPTHRGLEEKVRRIIEHATAFSVAKVESGKRQLTLTANRYGGGVDQVVLLERRWFNPGPLTDVRLAF